LTVGWSRDTRDSALVPTMGRWQRLNGEWGVSGDTRYIKTNYQFQQYLPLNKKFTLAFNAELGWGKGLGGREYPLFKNFFGGGLGSVRGFQQGTLGGSTFLLDAAGAPTTQVSYVGGPKKVVLNTELLAPFPGAGNDRTLRLFGFFDVGNVYAAADNMDFADLRASTGMGVSWISPIGPLRIAFAHAIRKLPTDKTQTLQFQIGTSF
jgi:outer membrane protein insertion porin family